jgi:hypothetical protein
LPGRVLRTEVAQQVGPDGVGGVAQQLDEATSKKGEKLLTRVPSHA